MSAVSCVVDGRREPCPVLQPANTKGNTILLSIPFPNTLQTYTYTQVSVYVCTTVQYVRTHDFSSSSISSDVQIVDRADEYID